MSEKTGISWTDVTWNIARGCTKVDADCKFCYMYRESLDGTRYQPKEVTRTKTVFNLPLRVKEPSRIFTCSLTDFFHPEIDSYRNEAWDIIRKCPQHTFQILTKRPERILKCLPPDWGEGWDNVWLGTSVGSGAKKSMKRIQQLMWVKAVKKAKLIFLSLEPLHGEIDLTEEFPLGGISCGAPILEYVDWVITGGESGNEHGKYLYRPCKLSWIESIVNDCKENDVPVFVKQMGTHLAKEMGLNSRHGSDMNEFPEHLRFQQFPNGLH